MSTTIIPYYSLTYCLSIIYLPTNLIIKEPFTDTHPSGHWLLIVVFSFTSRRICTSSSTRCDARIWFQLLMFSLRINYIPPDQIILPQQQLFQSNNALDGEDAQVMDRIWESLADPRFGRQSSKGYTKESPTIGPQMSKVVFNNQLYLNSFESYNQVQGS